ncbi:MAG: hypothetical protein U1E47_02965 [Rivihabitans pingtungensis]
MRRALLLEQRHLCAYTMQALLTAKQCERRGWHTGFACHIEHFLPQARQIAAESIDYRNMLAAIRPACRACIAGYGAQHKAAYDPAGQPFVALVSRRRQPFCLSWRWPRAYTGRPGASSVRVLNLNHPALVRMPRQAAISHALRPRANVRPVAAGGAQAAAAAVLVPKAAKLPAYCVAIAQAALKYAEREERAVRRGGRQHRAEPQATGATRSIRPVALSLSGRLEPLTKQRRQAGFVSDG